MSFGNTELTAYAVELRNPYISRREISVNGVYINDKLNIIGMTKKGDAIVEEPDGYRGKF